MIDWLWETLFLSAALLGGILALRGRSPDSISRHVPDGYQRKLLWVSDRARRMGIHLVAGKGSGKSRMMGRIIAWLDFIKGIPQLVLDPVGGTIDNFLDKMLRLPQVVQEELWPRVTYVDMSGRGGRVIPMPQGVEIDNLIIFLAYQQGFSGRTWGRPVLDQWEQEVLRVYPQQQGADEFPAALF